MSSPQIAAAFVLAGLILGSLTHSAPAIDQIIFKDGFTIVGKRSQEKDRITDPNNGTSVILPKNQGFDIIETGPKWILFSNRTYPIGKVIENVNRDPARSEYKRDVRITGGFPMPAGNRVKVGEFNDRWVRKIRIDNDATKTWAEIEQRIHLISPTVMVMPSTNYQWYPFYDTREHDPAFVRKLLVLHPDLDEAKSGPVVSKRLDIAQFMKDAGWLDAAQKEIDDAKAAIPGEWPKDQNDRLSKLVEEIRKAQSANVVIELERAVRAGKYILARELLTRFDDKLAEPAIAKQFATLQANVEIVEPRWEKARKLLRRALDRLGGAGPARGAAGGGAMLAAANITMPEGQALLLSAGEQVLSELHPDTAERVEHFATAADQAERRLAANQDPGVSADKLVAQAVTGWLKGKNGAEQNVDTALKYWKWRDMLLAYQNEPILNNRRALYQNVAVTGTALTPDEIAQLIGYLPPPLPENLQQRNGTLITPGPNSLTGIYRINTGPLPETAKGIDYCVRLPNEYHHGRPSRLLLALTNNNVPPEQLVAQLAPEADRNGYIIVAPNWVTEFDGPYEYKGDQHYKARAVLRDALRRFRIDNDRVFLFGFLEGANFAMDLGMSHPDLFAGVVAMGANPKDFNMFRHYWPNAQRLPFYIVIGAIAADSMSNVRELLSNWMPKGYPSLAVVYRGRGFEWFAPEVPIAFDWMEPKKRIPGTQALKLNEPLHPWMTMRNADDRFYWVGSSNLHRQNKLENWEGKQGVPAEIFADIRQGNQIILRTRGTQSVVVWLDRNMIDWSKPVSVQLDGASPPGYKPKILKPDIELMLEQLHQHGDRSLLFLNRLEFPTTR